MLLLSLLLNPILGVFFIIANKAKASSLNTLKVVAISIAIFNFFLSLVIFILFDFSTNQFQFVQEYHDIRYYDLYLGLDGLSIYFVLLTTIISPISLLSNWNSIDKQVVAYIIIILLLETLLLSVFLVLDILLFYVFFESILPPLFIVIGIFGSDNRVKASFYLFLYTLCGSLFLLLSILAMLSIMSVTDFETLFKGNFIYIAQLFLFYGIFIAFAVKTPTIFLNTWLLKAHVESPLGGSIILAAIVLKLSLYGILRLILPLLTKAYMEYTYVIYLIGVITIVYASLSTLRTVDIKELIAYSSVSHAAVYLLGVFSNCIQGIGGAITLGIAHGFVSPGLFISGGGVLYDRCHTRVMSFYRGVTQVMPLFAILFFILCLANCGAPLTLNFIGEFLSLYGVFERSALYGVLGSSSIIFSAAYTMYMFQRIAFGGAYPRMLTVVMPDLTKREFSILMILTILTVILGIYPAIILDGLFYTLSTVLYNYDISIIGHSNVDCSLLLFTSFYPRKVGRSNVDRSLLGGSSFYPLNFKRSFFYTYGKPSKVMDYANSDWWMFYETYENVYLDPLFHFYIADILKGLGEHNRLATLKVYYIRKQKGGFTYNPTMLHKFLRDHSIKYIMNNLTRAHVDLGLVGCMNVHVPYSNFSTHEWERITSKMCSDLTSNIKYINKTLRDDKAYNHSKKNFHIPMEFSNELYLVIDVQHIGDDIKLYKGGACNMVQLNSVHINL